MEKFSFTVSSDEAGHQVKKLIKAKYHLSSRLMTKIKYQDLITLNGEKVPGYVVVSEGDEVIVSIPDETSHFEPLDIPIDVIYEDDDLLIINKQAGVTCHPTKGHPTDTIANGIMKYIQDTGQNFKIRFVNRLDMDTSGVLVIAKNSHAQAELNKQMMSGLTEKKYLAILSGIVDLDELKETCGITLSGNEFLVDLPIGRPSPESKKRSVTKDDSGYPSQTLVKVLRTSKQLNIKQELRNSIAKIPLDSSQKNDDLASATLVEINLLTGRTHQIRVHMEYLGYPLVGDSLYGGPTDLLSRQALHAESFTCHHPITGNKISFQAKTPDDIEGLIQNLFY